MTLAQNDQFHAPNKARLRKHCGYLETKKWFLIIGTSKMHIHTLIQYVLQIHHGGEKKHLNFTFGTMLKKIMPLVQTK